MTTSINSKHFIILHAEDDENHAKFVQFSLKDSMTSVSLKHVINGEEALDYLNNRNKFWNKEDNPIPDLILLDLRMPRIDGITVLKEIKSSVKFKKIPVVVLSSSAAEQDISMCYNYNANSYMIKPLDFDKFIQLINVIVSYWFNFNCSSFLNKDERMGKF